MQFLQCLSCHLSLNHVLLPIQDGVVHMALSPDGTKLAVVYLSGSLSLWQVPSLCQQNVWSVDQQVFLRCNLLILEFERHILLRDKKKRSGYQALKPYKHSFLSSPQTRQMTQDCQNQIPLWGSTEVVWGQVSFHVFFGMFKMTLSVVCYYELLLLQSKQQMQIWS